MRIDGWAVRQLGMGWTDPGLLWLALSSEVCVSHGKARCSFSVAGRRERTRDEELREGTSRGGHIPVLCIPESSVTSWH